MLLYYGGGHRDGFLETCICGGGSIALEPSQSAVMNPWGRLLYDFNLEQALPCPVAANVSATITWTSRGCQFPPQLSGFRGHVVIIIASRVPKSIISWHSRRRLDRDVSRGKRVSGSRMLDCQGALTACASTNEPTRHRQPSDTVIDTAHSARLPGPLR